MIKHHVVILIGAILVGCGKPARSPEPEARKPEPAETVSAVVKTNGLPAPAALSTQKTATVVSAVIHEPTRTPAGATDFEGRMAELAALMNNTDFAEAIRVGREMQNTFREPEQVNRLDDTLRQLAEYRRAAPPLVIAVKNLAAADAQAAQAAQNELEEADELGRIYLRHALRTQPEATAVEAGEFLIALNDTEAIPIFMSHVKTNSVSPLGRTSVRALVIMTKKLPPDVAPACFEIVRADTAFSATPVFDILEAVFLRVCERDEARFNERVGCAEGADVLRAHLKAALLSTNAAARAWACARQPEFLPLMNGLRATYHANVTFSTHVLDRIETQPLVEIASKAFPVPGGGTNTLSARWSGDLQVRQAGEYVFTLQCGPSALQTTQLWVDEENLSAVDNWGTLNWQPQTFKKALSNGWYAVRLEYTKDNSTPDGSIRFVWAGPSAVMRSRPWPEEIDSIVRAMEDLSATNSSAWRAARTVLAEAGEVSRVYMRNAIVNAPAGMAVAAASLLAEWGDTNAPPVLLARLKTEKNAAMKNRFTDALCELAEVIKPDVFPELYRMALVEGAEEMNPYASSLCAALWRVCGEDPKKFGTLVGDAAGYAKLAAHVQTALSSKDGSALARACRNGYPLVPMMPGLRGRYYDDPEFFKLALERLDGRVEVGNRQFPLATNRQDNISAEWIGSLRVVQAGEYSFWAGGQTYVGIYVDGKLVNTGNWTQEAKVTLAVGRHPVRITFMQNQPGGNSSASVSWQGPGVARQVLASDVLRSAPWEGKLTELDKAVTALTATERAQVIGARTVLAEAGEVGRAYLRNAILNAPAGMAAATASLLAEWGDTNAPPMLLARLKVDKDAALIGRLTDALCELAGGIKPDIFPELYRTAFAPDAGEMNPYVSILCAALLARQGDAAAFNTLVKDAQGHQALTRHVQAALASTSDETVRLACLRGAPIAPVMQGLLGRYCAGQAFINPVLETVDLQVNVNNRDFRFPDKRQDDISVRWTGFLDIAVPGSCTFIVNAQGGANVWVDDQLVAQSLGWAENKKDAVKLAKGWHKLRVDFWQNSGNSQVQLSWIPPNGTREVIPAAVLKTPPAASFLAQIEKTVAGLPAAKPEELVAAGALLKSYGAVSGFYLDRALRRANPEMIAPFVTMLVEIRDVSLAGKIREMRKTSAPLASKIDACLADLALKGAPSQAPWFYAVMKADTDKAFPMCGPMLSKVMQETCKNNGNVFNALVGDPQGQATLKAHLDALPKPDAK
jgi:hypothetical protein